MDLIAFESAYNRVFNHNLDRELAPDWSFG